MIFFEKEKITDHSGLEYVYANGDVIDDAGFLKPSPEGTRLIASGGSGDLGITEYDDGRDKTDKILDSLPPLK